MAPHDCALALSGTGFTAIADGDQSKAQSAFEQSLPLFLETGDRLGGALAAAVLGHVLASQHDDQQARKALEQSLTLLQETDTSDGTDEDRVQRLLIVALVDNFLGQIQLSEADYDRATQLFTAALEAARSTADRDPFTVLISLYDLALSSQGRGDLDGAAGLLRQGLSLAAEAGDEPAAAYYLEALAALARQQDDPQRAARLLAAAGAQLQASGSGWLHAYVPRPNDHNIEAELRSRMGDTAYEQAAARGRSLTGRRAIQDGLKDAQQDPQRQENPA